MSLLFLNCFSNNNGSNLDAQKLEQSSQSKNAHGCNVSGLEIRKKGQLLPTEEIFVKLDTKLGTLLLVVS
jgi:hypothetical protein